MRLRTWESYWLLKNGLMYSYPMVTENLETEILVIGGGITGALISHALLNEGYKVALLDKGDIAQGSTAASTTMLQYEIDVRLYELSEMIGEKAAAACYLGGIKAIGQLEKLINDTGIDCGFEKKESLYLVHDKSMIETMKKEFLLRDKYQLGVQWMEGNEIESIYGIKSFGGILSETAAAMDGYKFTHELIHYNINRGLQVFDQTEIEDYIFHPLPSVKTIEGHVIHCRKIIFCTGYEATQLLKEKVAKLFYTYACISEQNIRLPEALEQTLVWNTSDPYLYMRTTPDQRLLMGGEDSSTHFPFFQQQIKERKSIALQKSLNSIMPGIHFIEDYSWGGTFGSTTDGLPYIGASPEFVNAFFVLGFGGNGITFSVQGMEIITALLKGDDHPLAYYYRFGR